MEFTFKHGNFVDVQMFMKLLDKCKYGAWYKVTITKLAPKSKPQLGYYYGLLLPEIHKQLVADGHTKTLHIIDRDLEIPISQDDAHEIVKYFCAKLPDKTDVRDMDEASMTRFIENVLQFAGMLNMNVDKLKEKGAVK